MPVLAAPALFTSLIINVGLEVGLAVGASIALSSALFTVAVFGGLVALQFALKPKTPESNLPNPETGSVPLRQTIPSRVFAYGTNRLSGYYMLFEEMGGASFDVTAFHSGKIAGIRGVYLHDDLVTFNESGQVVSGPPDGAYADIPGVATNLVFLGYRLGHSTEIAHFQGQAIDEIWTAAHRGDGIASLALRCNSAPIENQLGVYPHGKPEPSVVADCLQIWDPRDPAQNPDDPATWVAYFDHSLATKYAIGERVLSNGAVYYSLVNENLGHDPFTDKRRWRRVDTNPVLQLIDYMTNQDHGMGLDRSLMIDPVLDALIVEANICDETESVSGGDFEARYSSNGFATFTTDPANVIGGILATCDGWLSETFDGAIALKVGAYREPDVTITADHIVGFSINDGVPDEDAVNVLELNYTSPDNLYKLVSGQSVRLESNISDTGRIRSQTLDLPWVHSHSQARRLQSRAMSRMSSTLRGTIVTTLYGLLVEGERWVRLQYPLFNQTADCVIEIQPGGSVDLAKGQVTIEWILIDPATVDDWTPEDAGAAPTVPPSPSPTPLPVPNNVGGEAVGDPPFHLDISFDDPERPDLSYLIRYRLADDGTGNPGVWTPVSVTSPTIDGGRVYATIYPASADAYEVEVATVGPGGSRSEWSDPAILALVSSSLDYSLPQNSGYLLLLQI